MRLELSGLKPLSSYIHNLGTRSGRSISHYARFDALQRAHLLRNAVFLWLLGWSDMGFAS